MEGVNSSTITVVGSDALSGYHVAPRTNENPSQIGGSTRAVAPQVVASQPPATVGGMVAGSGSPMKKKRGRPRKYAADGSATGALSPKPISSSVPPPVIDFSAGKRRKVRSPTSIAKQHHPRIESDGLSEWVSCSVGANFTPHIITVNAGEDVTMKVISFSQQGPRAICILSASGVISSVTLRQPDSSGGTLTYEGHFEILSLTGSFMPAEIGGIRNRSGGMSVSLASPDGRVVGGGVAGLLVAASPVQVVVGSFLAGNQLEQKTKKHKFDPIAVTQASAFTISSPDMDDPHRSSTTWFPPPLDSRDRPTDINVTLPGK